jgi:hypothetical protein
MAMACKLFDIERNAQKQGLDTTAMKAVRQERSKPVLEEIRRLLDTWSPQVLPKSPIGNRYEPCVGLEFYTLHYIDFVEVSYLNIIVHKGRLIDADSGRKLFGLAAERLVHFKLLLGKSFVNWKPHNHHSLK